MLPMRNHLFIDKHTLIIFEQKMVYEQNLERMLVSTQNNEQVPYWRYFL